MFLRTLTLFSIICFALSDRCHKTLGQFADLEGKVIHCIAENSVPVTMCIKCHDNYIDVLKKYDILANNCSSIYFNKDRINLIASTKSALTGLWTKAFCDDCFNNNNRVTFFEKNSTLQTCLNTSGKDACEDCKTQYADLNNFYINLDQHNNGEVCYDLQDLMNRTRKMWSKELKCCPREKNVTLFIITLIITSFLPVLFYVTTFIETKRRENRSTTLFDEDSERSPLLSSSSHQNNANDINNPTESTVHNHSSNANINNPSTSKPFTAPYKKDLNIKLDAEIN